ncbi:MAG: hypothetical protein V1780_04395 [Chloroflexota bacterium]
MFKDLRQFIARAEEVGEVKRVDGADWNLEIGLITEAEGQEAHPRLMLFDHIKGHQPGYRVATNPFSSPRRVAMCYGLPEDLAGIDLVRAVKERLARGGSPHPAGGGQDRAGDGERLYRPGRGHHEVPQPLVAPGRRWPLHRHRLGDHHPRP